MNLLISVDMEGIAGVVLPEHTMSSHREYDRFRRLMTAEVNAAVSGAAKAGADHIVVNDSHGSMSNVLIEELDPRAELISGRPKPLAMMQGISEKVDLVFLVGYHGMSGTAGAILEHTWHGGILKVSINGREVGECGVSAAIAGHFKVPVGLVTGDDAVTQEAIALLGDIETVEVKKGIGRTAAQCLHPTIAYERICAAAERAISAKAKPFFVDTPVTIAVRFHRATGAEMACLVPGARRIDGREVEWTGDSMFEAYKVFQIMASLSRG